MNDPSYNAFLAEIELFSCFDEAQQAILANSIQTEQYEFGDTVLSEGSHCKGVYIIHAGAVRLFSESKGHEVSLGVRKAGEIFAELAALRDFKTEYSVRASGKTTLLFIPREVFSELFTNNKDAESYFARFAALSAAGGVVRRLFNLKGKIDKDALEQHVKSLGIKKIAAGNVILDQGDNDDRRLYVIRHGEVSIVRKEQEAEYPLATLSQGEIFGEKACLLNQEQAASAIAKSDVVLLIIPEATVTFLLEHNPKLKEVLEQRISFHERELQRQVKLAERRNKRVLLDLISKPGRGENVIKRFPLVEQAEEMDCGAACLAMICKHHNIDLTLGKLREMANVTTEGATLDSLAKVGETLGFTTRGLKCTYESFKSLEMPFIAHWEGYHYIVVYGISSQHVWVADPAQGFRKLTRETFEKGWNGICLVFTPGANMVQLAATRSPWVRFVSYLKPYKKLLLNLLVATLVIEIMGIIPPVIVQNILDRVVVHHNVSLLTLLIVGLVISHLFRQITTVLRGYLSAFMIRNLDFAMMSQFFKHTLSLPLSFFNRRKTGDVFARFQENETIRDFLTESTISTLLNLLMVFVYFTVLFAYSPSLSLLLIALVLPILLLTVLVTPKIKDYARKTFESSTDAESTLMETISGAETIKAMGVERPLRMKWEKKYAAALDVQYRSEKFTLLVGAASQILNAATTVLILWLGATLVLEQQLTIGQLIAFNMLMGSVMSPLMGLVGMWDELHEAGVAMERLGDVLDMEPEESPAGVASRIAIPDLRGHIQFENVYYRYGGKETAYVLENISFEIEEGSTVAIVGHSGSGKSTLAKMVVGFYPPTEGKILVDGYDLSLVDKEYFRPQIGYVMQSNLLFSGTIAENIAFGESNPDRKRIIEVATMADAHGFISKMPLGYEQLVGERGAGLSGGQMQRLCIARSIYHDPRLLIFDEATSALDTQSESNILHNLQDVLKGRSAIIIAHRLSTIMNADKILVLYNGSIIEEGNHQELISRQGMYYQLIQKQISQTS